MNELQNFCVERQLNKNMEDAFKAYIRSAFSTAYAIRPGDTLSGMMNNMTRERVEEMWQKFVIDWKEVITQG